MTNLYVPAKVIGTRELREVMTDVATAMATAGAEIAELRKRVRKDVCEQLVLDGADLATAQATADELGARMDALSAAVHGAGPAARDVARYVETVALVGARFHAKRNARIMHGEV